MIQKQQQKFTPDQAIPKAKYFCAYQERCHSEVKSKLYDFGLNTKEVDELLSILISEDYLNEQRFAIHFAGGKFRMKHWGKVKIKYELKQKQVSEYCIKKALLQIDEEDYFKTMQKLFDDKIATLRAEKNIFTKRKKVFDYLRQKGYETQLISEMLKENL